MTGTGLPTASSADVARLAPSVAVIPVGAFEQHGAHLPLATDAIIATALAKAVAHRVSALEVPTIAVSCSHEHAAFAGTVSVRAETLAAMVRDMVASLQRSGITWVVLLNAHGGNYVLANLAQELNVEKPRVILAPGPQMWVSAARAAGMASTPDEDMHGGEIETSVMLHLAPELVGPERKWVDHACPQRPLLTLYGMEHYAPQGIIGRPSLATAQKGQRCFDVLVEQICAQLLAIQGVGVDTSMATGAGCTVRMG